MHKILFASLLAVLSCSSYAATDSCQEQIADISAKLSAAKANHNVHAQQRLETALDKVKTYCTDERQSARAGQAVREKQQKVARAETDLKSAENELAQAQSDGRADKIAKKTDKVAEKKQKLEAARSELRQAHSDNEKLTR